MTQPVKTSSRLLARVPSLSVHQAEVEARLSQLVKAATEAWPAWIDMSAYVDHIASVIADANEPWEALQALHVSDLYLVAAALHESAPAYAVLEEQIRRITQRQVARLGGQKSEVDDLASEVSEKILVGVNGRTARIGDYKARGSLQGWLRATVTRTYLNSKRKHHREVLVGEDAILSALEEEHSDPVLFHMKAQYRTEFSAAFEDAIAALSDRQRGMLRYRFVDGASVDAIAAVYRIHRSSCHRWISEARAVLAKETEKQLCKRLASNPSEIEAIRYLVESQLELSLSRLFA